MVHCVFARVPQGVVQRLGPPEGMVSAREVSDLEAFDEGPCGLLHGVQHFDKGHH